MPKSLPLRQLDDAITSVTSHIHDYTKSEKNFTRKRKLDADTLIKTTLNMQGNSLNAEIYDAFPDIGKRMTASAYEQAKGKLSYKAFEDVLHEYNKTMTDKTMDVAASYRVYAVDGSSFSVPYDKKSEFAIDFKMTCKAIRQHYRLYTVEGDIWADILSYINPVRPGWQDKRRLRYKPAVWFLYRVA